MQSARFHTDETFAPIVAVLRKCVKLRTDKNKKQDEECFAHILVMVREELEDLLTVLYAQLKPEDEFSQLFAELAAKAKTEARKGTQGGRPSITNDIGTTAVLALSDLFARVARPRGGVWKLSAAERSLFVLFMRAALLPLDSDDLVENVTTRWDAARRIIKPRKGLRALGLPSKIPLRLAEHPDEHGRTSACKAKRKRRKSVLRLTARTLSPRNTQPR